MFYLITIPYRPNGTESLFKCICNCKTCMWYIEAVSPWSLKISAFSFTFQTEQMRDGKASRLRFCGYQYSILVHMLPLGSLTLPNKKFLGANSSHALFIQSKCSCCWEKHAQLVLFFLFLKSTIRNYLKDSSCQVPTDKFIL